MYLRFVFLLSTRVAAWLRLSPREEAWQTAENLILRHHQFVVLQRRQPRHPDVNWADRALLAIRLSVIPKARRQGLQLLCPLLTASTLGGQVGMSCPWRSGRDPRLVQPGHDGRREAREDRGLWLTILTRVFTSTA